MLTGVLVNADSCDTIHCVLPGVCEVNIEKHTMHDSVILGVCKVSVDRCTIVCCQVCVK